MVCALVLKISEVAVVISSATIINIIILSLIILSIIGLRLLYIENTNRFRHLKQQIFVVGALLGNALISKGKIILGKIIKNLHGKWFVHLC